MDQETAGKELESNDDAAGKDSRLEWTAPEAGEYLVLVRDLNNRGGPEYVYHLVARHGTLQFDRITSYPDVLFYTPAAMRGQSGVTVDATARLPAGAGRSTVVAHGSGPLPDAGLVSVPLNGAGRTLVRSTQRLVVDVTYRRADGRVTRQAPFTVSFAPRP